MVGSKTRKKRIYLGNSIHPSIHHQLGEKTKLCVCFRETQFQLKYIILQSSGGRKLKRRPLLPWPFLKNRRPTTIHDDDSVDEREKAALNYIPKTMSVCCYLPLLWLCLLFAFISIQFSKKLNPRMNKVCTQSGSKCATKDIAISFLFLCKLHGIHHTTKKT